MPGRRPTRERLPHSPPEWRLAEAQAEQLATRPDVRVSNVARNDWSTISIDELRECGLNDQAVAVRVQKGWLHKIHRAVYAVGHPHLAPEGVFMAAVKACEPSVLSHYSAAALNRYTDWDDRDPEVTVLGGSHRAHPGIRIHRTCYLDSVDVTRVAGIPVTSPARTLLDLAAVVPYRGLRRAVGQAQSLRTVTIGELGEVLARLGPRRGSANLAKLVAMGPAPTRSELEDTVLALILAGGFAKPDVNKPLWLSGRRVVPDFRWSEQRLVIEADGSAWHDNKLAREDDAERQALLEAHDYHVIRVTWDQAVRAQAQTLRRIANGGAPRVRRAEVARGAYASICAIARSGASASSGQSAGSGGHQA